MKFLGVLLILLSAAGTPSAQEDGGGRAFSFPLTREARRLAELATEHIEAGRFGKAITVLEEMMIEETDTVLPESFSPSADLRSAHPAYPGAGAWAKRTLFHLPAEARDQYRERYDLIASASLDEALRRGDRRALASIIDRWPLCDAAVRASWILGDLELERGAARDALASWERAASVLEVLGRSEPEGIERRRKLALAVLRRERPAGAPQATRAKRLQRALETPEPSLARAPIPSPEATSWTTPLDLSPFDPGYAREPYSYSLFPEVAGDRVLVSSSLEVFALDALDGRLLWRSGRPAGWERLDETSRRALFEGLDRSRIRVQPAAGGGVVVAALQLPFSDSDNEDYRGIEVMSSIPQRRLFAFDLATGRELWNHAPSLRFDALEQSFRPKGPRSFAQRMLIAGAPTVSGDRVLVPCYVLEGRIDYHVACYELSTGDLLWSTGVVSGQRSRNMFGRALEEFCASPVVVSGDRVVVQTELGTVAALDLADGSILWESLYRQMALPKTAGYQLTSRPVTWRVSPPAVAGDVVLATPVDSAELTCFDLRDGRVLWSLDQDMLARLGGDRHGSPFDCIIGIGRNAFFLGGGRVARFGVPGGLGGGGFPRMEWAVALDPAYAFDRAARPLLCRDGVLVPLPDQRLFLDRTDGRQQRSLSERWDFSRYGNAWLGGGRLFTLNSTQVSGFFDWNLLLASQAELLARNPKDPEARIQAVSLLARRAEAALSEGETFAALQFLDEARSTLDPLLEDGTAPAGSTPRVSSALFGVLLAQARAQEAAGRSDDALASLERALPLARTPAEVRDTLLSKEATLGRPEQLAERLAVLAELEERVGNLPLSWDKLPELPADALRPASSRASRTGDLRSPTEERDARSDGTADAPPVGLWVLITRAELTSGEGDLGAALADWQHILERYPGRELPSGESSTAYASERIAATLRDPAGRAAYGPFEGRARDLLGRALASGRPEELERLVRLYPHSEAAREAEDARLDMAYRSADLLGVAGIAYGSSLGSSEPDGGREGALQERAWLALSRLLGRAGNEAFELGMLRALARRDPDGVSPLTEDGELPLAKLLHAAEALRTVRTTRLPRFRAQSEIAFLRAGSFTSIGHLIAPDAPETDAPDVEVFLLDRADPESRSQAGRHEGTHLVGFASTNPAEVLFERVLPGTVPGGAAGKRTAAAGERRVVLATGESLMAFDRAGEVLWERPLGAPVVSLDIESGVVVLLQGSPSPFSLAAFDEVSGTPLWRIEMDPNGAWRPPVLGNGRLVLTSKPYGKPATARVIDVALGEETASLDLGSMLEPRVESCAWIEGEQLFVPTFRRVGRSPQGIDLFDLSGGVRAANVALPLEEEFLAVARHGGEVFLVTSATGTGSSGGVYRLDPEWATLRRLVPLRSGESPIGLHRRALTTLPSAELFTLTTAGEGRVSIRSIPLTSGSGWTGSLTLPDLDPGRRPSLPAVSGESVALVLPQRNPRSRLSGSGRLIFLDRDTGALQFGRPLSGSLGTAERIEISGLGDALFLRGRGNRSRGWQLEILENRR